VAGADTALGDRTDMVYMNTNVTRGAGEFVVTATGMATEVGHISGLLAGEQAVKTPLTRQMDRLTRQILVIAGIALVASMALNLSRGETFNAVFNAAVAFAIAAIPVGLPTVVTTILARGTLQLAKAGAIMKRLTSTQTLGSTSAINSDKTGTLTMNQMTAVQMSAAGRRYAVGGNGYSTAGRITRVGGQADIGLDEFLVPMVLCSDAVVRDGELVGDPTEGALVVLAAKGGIDAVSTREQYPRIAELPFDAAYKLMATFHTMTDASGKQVIRCFVKGAADQLLARAPRSSAPTTARRQRTTRSGNGTWPRISGWASRARGSWPPRARTSTRPPSTPAPICCRWSPGWSCSPWSAWPTRRVRPPRPRSRRRGRPGSGSG